MSLNPFDGEIAFRPPAETVRRLSVQAAGVTVLSSGLGLAVQTVSTVVLARLLTPDDFGVVAMVTTFSLLLVSFGGNGFTEAVIQCDEVTRALASNLFWITVGMGALLTVGFGAAGSLLAWLYKDPRVAHVALGVSLSIFVTSISVIHLALLKRVMRFRAISINEIGSRAISLLVAIVLAWAGWGYWALVVSTVAQAAIQSIGAFCLCPWLPGLPRRATGTASLVRFATHVYGRFTLNYGARNLDNLLVGWFFQAQALGFYKKAYDLFALSAGQFVAPLANVAESALSRLESDLDHYKRFFVNALAVMTFLGMGLGGVLTLVGRDLIRVVLGPRWGVAGEIFTYFGPGVGIMFLYYTHGWIHVSIGRADRWFRWGILELVFTSLLFVIGLHWGPKGVAAAWTVSFWALTLPAFWFAGRPINLKVAQVLPAVWKYILASLLAGFACAACVGKIWGFVPAASVGEACARIVMVSLLFGTLYLGAVILLHRGLYPLYLVGGILVEMMSSGAGSRQGVGETVTAYSGDNLPRIGSGESNAGVGGGLSDDVGCTAGKVGESAAYTPLVSILVPAYNAQNWIFETLRSALAQTWQRKEIIVVDDGSTDRTVEIVRGFESEGVRLATQKNQGAAAARNMAFSLSKGDYIQWLDADDLLAPDKIALQMKLAEQPGCKMDLISSAWGRFIYRSRRAKFIPSALWCDLSPVEWLLRKMGQNLYMPPIVWLVSRELTEAAGPWDTRLLGDDDGEYFCRVILASRRVRFVPEAKTYYRGPGLAFRSLSYIGLSTRKLDAHWLSIRLHIEYLLSTADSERVRAACLKFLDASMMYFYPESKEILEEAQNLARELGGQLETPRLSWKYSWIKAIFGWSLAKWSQQSLLRVRWSVEKFWDKTLNSIEKEMAKPRGDLQATRPEPIRASLDHADQKIG